MKIIVLPIVTVVMSVLGFLLLVRDKKENFSTTENESLPTKIYTRGMLIYSLVMLFVTVASSVVFSLFYDNIDIVSGVKNVIFLSILWPIAYIDFKVYRIPNSFIILGLVCRVVLIPIELFSSGCSFTLLIADAVAAAALLLSALLCGLCIKNSIGFGDMKLFLVMGLLLGLDRLWGAVFLSLITSFIIAVVLLITKKKGKKDAIPFGPALAIGTYLALLLNVM